MEIQILDYLRSSTELTDLIGKDRLFPIFASDLKRAALEYQYRPLKGGTVKQSQLSINIIWTNYDQILEITQLLNKLLDFDLSSTFITWENIKFNSRIAGGSTPLYRSDLKLYQINLNYILTWRNIKL